MVSVLIISTVGRWAKGTKLKPRGFEEKIILGRVAVNFGN